MTAWLVYRTEATYRDAVEIVAADPLARDDTAALTRLAVMRVFHHTQPDLEPPRHAVSSRDATQAVEAARRLRAEHSGAR